MAHMWMLIAAAQAAQSLMKGAQEYQQGRFEAEVAGANAKIAEGNAGRARQDAALAEEAQRREARQALGRAAAVSAQASGASPAQGSLGLLNRQSAIAAEADAHNIRYEGEMEAYAQETQAAQFKAERKAAIQRARGAVISGVLGAASSALSAKSQYGGAGGGAKPAGAKTPAPRAPATQRRHYTQLRPPRRY